MKCQFLKVKPRAVDTVAVAAEVDDHLGESCVMIQTWWSGEGFTLTIEDRGETPMRQTQEVDLTWTQWEAVRDCLHKARKHKKKAKPSPAVAGFNAR